MKKLFNSKTMILMLALVLSVSFLFTACGQKTETPAGDTTTAADETTAADSGLTGKITISGSTSVQPLAQDLADAFSETNSGVTIDVQAGGSSQGIKDASEGTSDIGNSSRDLKDDEKNLGLTEHVIAHDGIAIVLHPTNKIENLTKEQLVKIFKGEIKNWKEVGGDDKEILVVSREEGSGTRGAFEELLKLEEKQGDKKISLVRADALIADGTGAVKANVSTKDNAIGYTSLGFVDETMKKIKVEGIECAVATIKDKSYPIARPFLMLTKGDLRPEVKAFLDFILSDKGQEIVAKKYISVK